MLSYQNLRYLHAQSTKPTALGDNRKSARSSRARISSPVSCAHAHITMAHGHCRCAFRNLPIQLGQHAGTILPASWPELEAQELPPTSFVLPEGQEEDLDKVCVLSQPSYIRLIVTWLHPPGARYTRVRAQVTNGNFVSYIVNHSSLEKYVAFSQVCFRGHHVRYA